MKHGLALTTLAMLLVLMPLTARSAGHEDATPPAGLTVEVDSLAGMLGLLPPLPLDDEATPMVSYANIAAQLAVVGAPTPAGIDDPAFVDAWVPATRGLALPSTFRRMNRPEWREVFGFDIAQVDQSVEYAMLPVAITILRGRFDVMELDRAWERGGYQPVEVEHGTVYSVRDDYEIDTADPGSRMALASFNHTALIDNQTLVYSSAGDNVRQALAAAAGQGASFADQVAVTPLVMNVPPDLVSAIVVGGSALMAQGDPAAVMLQQTPGADDVVAIATRLADPSIGGQSLPPVAAALLGQTAGYLPRSFGADSTSTPGSGPEARLAVALTMIHRGGAEAAVSVIEERLATGSDAERERPYVELFPERQVRLAPEGPVVLIDLSLGEETPPTHPHRHAVPPRSRVSDLVTVAGSRRLPEHAVRSVAEQPDAEQHEQRGAK